MARITRALPPLDEIDIELSQRSLADFTRTMWPVIQPATPLVWNWHMDVMCEHIQALLEGTLGKNNLLINVPPGSAKSTVLSVAAPAWMWIKNPSYSFTCAAGNDIVAVRDSVKCRDVLESQWYRKSFKPKWYFSRDQNAKLHFKNSKQGFRRATVAGQKVTGDRADALFIDDPLDAQHAHDDNRLDDLKTWWGAIANRLNSMVSSKRALIMQRLAARDLAGLILETEPDDWTHLIIPAEWEEKRRKTTSLGWTDPRTVEGEIFFPERYPASVLKAEYIRLSERGYEGQYQQRPHAAKGNIFRRGYVRFFKLADVARGVYTFTDRLVSIDSALKEGEENDYSVGLHMARGPAQRGIYILDRFRGQYNYPALKEKVVTWTSANPSNAVLIEDKASGIQLVQEFKESTSLPIVAVPKNKDKTLYAWPCVPAWEVGLIYVPEDAPWTSEFLEYLYEFPTGAYDDDVDAFTQAINFWLNSGGQGLGLLQYMAAEAENKPKEEAPGNAIISFMTDGVRR